MNFRPVHGGIVAEFVRHGASRFAVAVAFVACMTGCGPASPATTGEGPTNAAAAAMPRRFDTRGVVREVPEDGRTLVVRHEEIPGFMPRMTMQLSVRNTNELQGLAAGDEIRFRLMVVEDTHWIEGIEKLGKESARPAYPVPIVTSKRVPALKVGDSFPEVTLLGEAGAPVALSSLRGRAVALTFIFTRCPLPDFCPRMSKNFTRARNLLLGRGRSATNWHFLSISFDAENDTPEVLRQHARNYRGSNADRWLFAAADTNALAVLIPSTQLMVAREGASFSHNLRTVVLDPAGRVHRQFDGNSWTPEDLATALEEAARIPAR